MIEEGAKQLGRSYYTMDNDDYYKTMKKHIHDLEKMGFHFGPSAKNNGVIVATSKDKSNTTVGYRPVYSGAQISEYWKNAQYNKTTDLPYEPTAILNHNQSQGQYRIRPRGIIDWTGR